MWLRQANGTFVRPIGEMELCVWLIGASKFAVKKDEWHLSASATIKTDFEFLSETFCNRVRHAWQRMRFEHPNIACWVTGDGKSIVYQPITKQDDLEDWTKKTFVKEGPEVNNIEVLVSNFQPVEMMQCHIIPHTNEIVIHTPHWRTDGRGILILLNELLRLTSETRERLQINWGEEIKRLLPSLENVFDLPAQISPDEFEFVEEKVREILKKEPIMTIPSLGDQSPPQRAERIRLVLSKRDTANVVAACKRKGVTVTSAVHTALALTNMRFAERNTRGFPYRSSLRRDTRSELPENFQDARFASAICHITVTTDVPSGSTFDQALQLLNYEYKAGMPSLLRRSRRVFYQHLNDQLLQPGSEDGARACDIDITSIGILDGILQPSFPLSGEENSKFTISNVAVTPAMYSSSCGLAVWTFQGNMTLCMLYNDAYHTRNEAYRMLETVNSELMTGLGIVLSVK